MPSNTVTTARGRAGRRAVAAIGVLVVLAAAGGTAWALTSGSATSYRTAAVSRGAVDQSLTTTGEIAPVHSANVQFEVAGTVAKVDAVVGQNVSAGEQLARLDRSSLRTTLSAARSELTNAKLRLEEDESGETDTVAADSTTGRFDVARPTVVTSTSPKPPSSGPGGPSGSSGSSGSSGHGSVRADQRAVIAAQHRADEALAAARTALATEKAACAGELAGSGSTSASGTSPISCSAAITGLQHDQSQVATAQSAVLAGEQRLGADLASATSSLTKAQHDASSNSGSHGSASSQGSTQTVSAADLASDQASIDQNRASLATAKANLAQATIVAPISGTVAAVTIGKGDTVSAGSSDPAVEIVGSSQDQATVYVSQTQVREVKRGMPATVTPDGAGRALRGRVVDVGSTGSESDSGSVTYPVSVDISARAHSLVAGADAAVSITLATAAGVLTVPTSAVHFQGSTTYVDLLRHGKPVRRNVMVGAVGPALTEVTSGLAAGQRVVLANLNAAVPSSSTTGLGGGRFGPGGGSAFQFQSRVGGPGGVRVTEIGPGP